MFSLQSPHQDEYNEYTHHTIFNIKKEITETLPNTIIFAAMVFFSVIAMINELSCSSN